MEHKLEYISIKGGGTTCPLSESGELTPFYDGGFRSRKFKFDSKTHQNCKLIKIYDEKSTPEKLLKLSHLMNVGHEDTSCFINPSLPIGFNSLSAVELQALGDHSQVQKPFLVFVFKDNCFDLQSILKKDDYNSII